MKQRMKVPYEALRTFLVLCGFHHISAENFALGSLRSDNWQLGRPTASPFCLFSAYSVQLMKSLGRAGSNPSLRHIFSDLTRPCGVTATCLSSLSTSGTENLCYLAASAASHSPLGFLRSCVGHSTMQQRFLRRQDRDCFCE
jgi:hypothetical protein